ncbi:MAG: NADH-quinone oxidoreductase subunit M [Thermodesulfobacteriota bacterium]|nr:NADH-quinone oxidoreductase subunit M [Thermodesulfobacteriota bacterium]
MSQMDFPLLTWVTFFPLLGAAILLFLNKEKKETIRLVTLIVTLLEFAFSLPLFFQFRLDTPAMQFVEKVPWIPEYGISYFLGIDGISLFLVLLTTFFTLISVIACWNDIQEKVKEFMICILFLETGMIGVFVALDLFLFYVFWEVMLIPMYLLIGVWGNPKRRIYAAVKFFIYTMVGSVLMLVAILVLYFQNGAATGIYTFDLLELYKLQVPLSVQFWLFLAFGLAFAIKVPMFPFHTWLPDAHTEAPTVGSVLLAAVLLKMGTYGFLRFSIPLFPHASYQLVPLVSILAIIGIIYGALVCLVQKDLKRLIAFSSVSHLGFVMLGIFALNQQGIEGGILQMLNHGFSTGALFLIVGMIYERRHTRMIEDFGGLWKQMPVFAAFFMVVTLSSIGLPGLNGFVGEFLILVGTFKANRVFAVVAATGIILAAAYMLWMYQRVMFGELTKAENKVLKDLSAREVLVLGCITLFIFWIGVYPQTFLSRMEPTVKGYLTQVNAKYQAGLKLPEGEKVRVVQVEAKK